MLLFFVLFDDHWTAGGTKLDKNASSAVVIISWHFVESAIDKTIIPCVNHCRGLPHKFISLWNIESVAGLKVDVRGRRRPAKQRVTRRRLWFVISCLPLHGSWDRTSRRGILAAYKTWVQVNIHGRTRTTFDLEEVSRDSSCTWDFFQNALAFILRLCILGAAAKHWSKTKTSWTLFSCWGKSICTPPQCRSKPTGYGLKSSTRLNSSHAC